MAAEVKTETKPIRGYLVVGEYKERYAPGNTMVAPYWQTSGVFCFYLKHEDALARVESEEKISAKHIGEGNVRIRIIPLENDCKEILINEIKY